MNENTSRDPRARLGEYPIPGDAQVIRCKSCGAQIVWAKTGTGANVPLSLATIRVDDQGRRWALTHFADCPSASRHRKSVGAIRPQDTLKGYESPSIAHVIDLRDLPDYLARNGLVVTGSTLADDGHGKLIITLQTRKSV